MDAIAELFATVADKLGFTELATYLRSYRPRGSTPPSPTAPTAPVLGSTSVASGVITVPISTPGTGPDGVALYEFWMGASSGAETYLGRAAGTYTTAALTPGTYYFKAKSVPPSGVGVTPASFASSFSNEVSATVSGALTADTHAPAVPSQPTTDSGGAATLATVVSATPTADDTSHSGTEVVSGTDKLKWYLDTGSGYVYQNGRDSYPPAAGAESLVDFGDYKSGSGSDNGLTLSSVDVTSGKEAHYAASDGGITSKFGMTTGKVTLVIQPTSAVAASNFWGKPIGLEVRGSYDTKSVYFNVFLFPSAGLCKIGCEWRDAFGASAGQIANAVAYTFPIMLRLQFDPDTGVASADYSTNVVTPSWTNISTRTMEQIPKIYLSGKFGCSGGTANYLQYSRTVDSVGRLSFTGSQQIGATTTLSVACAMIDKAGNESAKSTARTVTYDALVGGGGGGGGGGGDVGGVLAQPLIGGYYIAEQVPDGYDDSGGTGFGTFAKNTDLQIINPVGNNIHTNTRAILIDWKTNNPTMKIGFYFDSHFVHNYDRASYVNVMLAHHDWLLRSSYPNGTLTNIDAPWGTCWVCNPYAGGSTDANGRTSNQFWGAYLRDRNFSNGAEGLAWDFHFDCSSAVIGGNSTRLLDIQFLDDFHATITFPGDYTRGTGTNNRSYPVNGSLDRIAQIKAANPGIEIVPNGPIENSNYAIPELYGVLDGSLMEDVHLNRYGWGGLESVRAYVQESVKQIRAGGYQLYGIQGLNADGSGPIIQGGNVVGQTAPGVYFRMHFCASLIFGDCYFLGQGSYFPGEWRWMPEYSINTATGLAYTYPNVSAGRHWMGKAVDNPQTSVRTSGLYVREYTNAVIALNPSNGALNLVLGYNVRRANTTTVITAGTAISVGPQDGFIGVKA